jgi:hypothetical protein
MLGLAQTPSSALSFLKTGAVCINGQTSVCVGYFIKPGDTLQILQGVFKSLTKTTY